MERWKLSSDRQCVEKVRDIVGLYLNPPDRALVLCVDEQSQIQAPIFPLLPRTPERRTHDYFRHRATRAASSPPPRDRVSTLPGDDRP
ncbi:MAG: hypothetical protein IIC73_02785 [Armatimonadetes bacterium]|nr:hypothetical protein [Armatimonadota bacterium]